MTDDAPAADWPAAAGDREADNRSWLTPGVGGVGAASFFSDAGHEVTTSVLPSFLTSTLGGSAATLGVIEGVSDALSGVMKLIGGPLANDPATRGRIASGGYLGTAIATGAIGAATTVWQAGALRAFAWVSRGLRSPARDSLLATLAPRSAFGRAFGLERAGDNLGAVAGPLLASVLVAWVGIRWTMYLAAIPGLFAAGAIIVTVREARRRPAPASTGPARRRFEFAALRRAGMGRALVPVAAFELGNIATTLLILRATDLLTDNGRSVTAATSLAVLLYAGHNLVAAAAALLGGRWLDRAGPRVVFTTAAALYAVAYAGFAAPVHAPLLLLAVFALAGAGIGLAETAESAMVARMLPDHLRGSGFGVLGGIQAGGDLLASAVVGILYVAVSPAAAFGYAAAWMLLTLVVLPFTTPRTGDTQGEGS
ncbi:MFS transporter [Jiangella anatolica]|uniref:MFS transporter n=1 Tax=Jiangella anatolica TaxID=2670374 RepID=A0A2W2BFU7_9ACTN|nr:MFS transporter [Jiangella anatolica]PZF86075.1 MFS transporter [Jiangella anatolica]